MIQKTIPNIFIILNDSVKKITEIISINKIALMLDIGYALLNSIFVNTIEYTIKLTP